MQNQLKEIGQALVSCSANCYHYIAGSRTSPSYIVWAEDGLDNLQGDNAIDLGVIEGTVDVFSKVEFDSLFDDVPAALEGIGCSVTLNSVDYEPDTELIHYEWVFNYAKVGSFGT